MDPKNKAPVNSRPWWEEYFSGQWDAHNGRGQTKYFMQRMAENLPPPEREYLASQEASILDWGCAFGEGVKVLAETFPRCRVAGLDFAERAVAEARRCFPRYEFRHSPDGAIGGRYDVLVCSHCLEHFSEPLQILRQHLRRCRCFYALLVPYKEVPLDASHVTQFHKEFFPDRLEGFTRVAAEVIDSDPKYWPGQMLLVVYASGAYLRERNGRDLQIREREKWDNYYAALPMLEIDGAMRDFSEDLADRIGELLPGGGKLLEAGCGAGWQSLALAEKGRFQVSLMDFSTEALGYAERIFAQHKLSAEFIGGDVFSCGEPKYDLVFNAGVLEHYTFDQQVAFLRGMASRSNKYVLALVPNRMCYWYWMWRMHRSARGNWPFGKEMPMADMSAAFEAAGLQFLGRWFGGATWSEFFIKDIVGIDPHLRDEILAVHCSPVVPEKHRAYLVAALGCKGSVPAVPSCWDPSSGLNDFTLDQLTASLADALAAAVGAEHRCKQLNDSLVEGQKVCESLRGELKKRSAEIARLGNALAEKKRIADATKELAALKKSRGYRMLLRWRRLRSRIAPPGSRRDSAARTLWRLKNPLDALNRVRRRFPSASLRRLLLPIKNTTALSWKLLARPGDAEQFPLVPGLVSVVIPVYNHAYLLRQAVDSVLAQSHRPIELIIVNDGSTDGVEEVLAKYARNPSVRVLTQPNQGLPKALSNGFEFARGEFWTWTSADNLMHPDQLRLLVEYLRSHDEATMVYADYTAIDSSGQGLSDPKFRPHNRRSPRDPEIHLPAADSFGRNADNFIGPCFLYRGQAGRLLGEYAPRMGIEDFDYWLRMSLIGRIAHLDGDRPLYYYRVHDDSLSGRAAELKITRRAQELVEFHRARADYFNQPWTIHADGATLLRLNKTETAPHKVVPWTGGRIESRNGEKQMLLVHADILPAAAKSNRGAGVVLAAWFHDDPHALDRYRAEAQGAADLCFAQDAATANRLALLTPNVFCAATGSKMLSLAVKWADSRTFDENNRKNAERARILPNVFRADNRPVRVLLQAGGFTQGGMEQVVLDLAESLRADNFDVSLLVLGKQGPDAERVRAAGIPVLSLPEKDREIHYRNLLKERRIELVNAHYSLFGAKIASEAGTPFVQTIHNTYVFLHPDRVKEYRTNDPFTSAYTCVSQMAAHYSDLKLGLPVSKMAVIPNGIDLRRLDAALADGNRESLRLELGLSDDDFVFLNVSAVQPIKCQILLVRAFAEILGDCPKAKLVLVGGGMFPDYQREARKAIVERGLKDSALMVGRREDAMRFYAAADAFVLPSLCEGWSLALAEALAAGLPAAASAVGSAPDLFSRFGGRLLQTPFGKITDLDCHNLEEYVAREDPRVKADLIAALKELYQQSSRQMVSDSQRRELDCREAYKPYGRLFRWLLQGGHPAAARAWTTARRAASNPAPLNGAAAEEFAGNVCPPPHRSSDVVLHFQTENAAAPPNVENRLDAVS